MQTAGNHQVEHQPQVAFHPDRDALADAPQFAHRTALRTGERRLHCAQQERARNAHLLQLLSQDARLERADISGDVRQLRHDHQLARQNRELATPLSIGRSGWLISRSR